MTRITKDPVAAKKADKGAGPEPRKGPGPERLKEAPGFDQHHWPDMADQTWQREIRTYYGVASQ